MRIPIAACATLVCVALSGCDRLHPAAPPSAPDPAAMARGRALFLEHCALCHGRRGDGRGPRRGSLSRPPADFENPLWAHEHDRAEVRRAIHDGVPGSDMPPWRRLGEPAVDDLADYVLSLAQHGATSP